MYQAKLLPACLAVSMALTCLSSDGEQPAEATPRATGAAARQTGPRITISKETTYITSPLRPDGYVDYIAALDEAFQKGVTTENNASVLLWKAMGPAGIDEKQRASYLKKLGMRPLPEKGDYFVSFDEFVKQTKAEPEARPKADGEERSAEDIAQDQFERASRDSWTDQEFPLVAAWLKVNEAPLALLAEASHRPRRYDPFLSQADESLISVLLPSIAQYRNAASALKTRATLRIGQEKWDEAWQDLLACHRLARLAAQGPTLIEGLVGCAIDGVACEGDRIFLTHAPLDKKRVATLRGDLAALPPLPPFATKLDESERFMYLDAVSMIAREGASKIQEYFGGQMAASVSAVLDWFGRTSIDWDEMLRTGNSWYDRLTDALAQPTRGERKAAFAKIERDLRKVHARSRDWKGLLARALLDSRQARSQAVAGVLLSLLVPAVEAVIDAEARQTMRFDLTQLAIELAAYRVDHGSYPARLEDLTPKYIAKPPVDVFSGEPVLYESDGEGYLLYSVGPNGKDDRGRGYDDRPDDVTRDDIAVRMGAAPTPPAEKQPR